MSNRYNYSHLFVVFLFFLAIGLIRSQDAFVNEYASIAFPGDGQGTIASFADYNKGLSAEDGLWKLFGDRWYPGYGGGYSEPGPVSFFWKITGLLFSQLEPDDIYDACVVLIYVLNGIAAYLLARYIRLNPYFSLLSAVFIVSLDNFDSRITGHLTLAAYFGFLIPIIFLLEVTRNPTSLKKTILLGFLIGFGFAINEYYGLFALEISVIYYFIVVWKKTTFLYTLKNGIFCSLSFLITLAVFYPFTFLGPIISRFNKTVSYPTRIIPPSDYLSYSLHNPLELFTSNFDIFASINQWIEKTNHFTGNNGGEFTYRIGFSILAFIIFFLILIKIMYGKFLFKKLLDKLTPFLLMYLLTIIISIHPEHPFLGQISFVNLHMEYSSILRVNSRAMVLGNVFLIFILGIILNEFSRNFLYTYSNRIFKFIVPLVLFVPYFISVADARNLNFRLWDRWVVHPIPESVKFVKILNEFPKGMTMDIPYHADNINVETNYIYALNKAYHGNDIANFVSRNTYRHPGLRWWSREVNRPNKNTIEKIRQSGIKYIIVWNHPENLPFGGNVDSDINFYKNATQLKTIISEDIGTIYQVIGVETYNKKAFGKYLNKTPAHGNYSYQMMYFLDTGEGTVQPTDVIKMNQKDSLSERQTNNYQKLNLTVNNINNYVMYGPFDVFDEGKYRFNFQFGEIDFFIKEGGTPSYIDKNIPCLKLEIFSHQDGIIAETIYSHNDLKNINNQPSFDIRINSVSTIEFRMMPLCTGEVFFSQIYFEQI